MEQHAPAATEQDQKELSAATKLFGMARIEAKLARAQRIEAALVALLERLEDLGQTNGANYSMNRDTVGGYTARDWALGYVNKETLEARAALES